MLRETVGRRGNEEVSQTKDSPSPERQPSKKGESNV